MSRCCVSQRAVRLSQHDHRRAGTDGHCRAHPRVHLLFGVDLLDQREDPEGFGVRTAEEAETTKPLAFNQGFYNLFLAIAIGVGTVLWARGCTSVGATLVFTGAGSMVAAGLVLLISSPDKASAALKQLVPPLLGIIALAAGLL